MIESLFTKSIYGIAAITAVSYFIALGLKKIFPKSLDPGAIAVIFFFVALLTIPSIPRYKFESNSLSSIEGKDWIRVINKTKWGDLLEPLTWFNAPTGSIYIVMPNNPIDGGFRDVLFRYEEKPRVRISDPDCSDKTISYSEPDGNGIFRYSSKEALRMTDKEVQIYCEYDWSKEKEALMKNLRKQ